jgi:ArsR family metal-binding transcriptional regulator
MKPFDYYSKPQTLYPNKKDYITFYVYDKGACIYSESSLSNTKSNLKEDYPNAVIQEVLDKEAYEAHRKEYDAESAKLHQEFVKDLFEEFGVCNNPKSIRCFELAWEHGHSSGYSEVYNYFGDFVELIRD